MGMTYCIMVGNFPTVASFWGTGVLSIPVDYP